AARPARGASHAPAAVPAHDLLIGDRVQPLAVVEPSQQRMLRAEVLRAPEPVGVPAPQIIVHAQAVAAAFADRTVVNLLEGVITGVVGAGDEGTARQVELTRCEHDAI